MGDCRTQPLIEAGEIRSLSPKPEETAGKFELFLFFQTLSVGQYSTLEL